MSKLIAGQIWASEDNSIRLKVIIPACNPNYATILFTKVTNATITRLCKWKKGNYETGFKVIDGAIKFKLVRKAKQVTKNWSLQNEPTK